MNLDKRLLQLARDSRAALVLTIGLGFAGGVLVVWQARLFSRVVERVFLGGRTLTDVSRLLFGLLVILLARAALSWGSEISANRIAVDVKDRMRRQLVEHLYALGPVFGRSERSGELVSAAVEGIEALDVYFSQYLPQLVLAALVPLTFLLFVFPLDMLSGVVLLATAPLIPLFMTLIGSLAAALTRRQWQTLSRMSAYFLDVLQGLTTLKLLGRSKQQAQVIAQVSERFRQTTMGVLRVTFLSALVLELVSTLSTAVVAVEVGLRLLYGHLEFEQAFFVLLLAPEFYLPLRMLGTRFHAGMTGVAAAKRIFELLSIPLPQVQRGATTAGDGVGFQTIEFQNVCVDYETGRQALSGASLRIEAGEKIALVGASGAGKTTIANLLLRFVQPTQGVVLVDGRSLDEIDPQSWRENVAWLSQNPYLFQGTVAENIRLSRPGASLEQVMDAARLAQAHEFIQAMPQGYDTPIGERALRLSGGQAQRLALARAFLKGAPLLILDEATANLDPEHEMLVQKALDRLLIGRTALIIAHRLGTVKNCDCIYVFEDGRVVESGVHEELLRQDGVYRRLLQAAAGEVADSETLRTYARPKADALSFPSADGARRFLVGEPPSRAGLGPLGHMLHLVAPFAGLAALAALMGFFTIGSSIGLMTTSAYIIAAAALHPSIAELQVAIVGVRFFGITRGLFRYLERYLSHQVTFRLLARLRVWFYQAVEPLAPARLADYRSGDLLARIMGDIESLENFYVRALAPPITALFVMSFTGLFLAGYSQWLALVIVCLFLVAGVVLPWSVRALGKGRGRRLVQQRAALEIALVDSLQGMADILAYGQGQRFLDRIGNASRSYVREQRAMARLSGFQAAVSVFLAGFGMWAALALAIPMVRDGQIPGVILPVLALAALTSFEAVAPLPLAAQYLEANLESARRLLEIAKAEPEVRDPTVAVPLPQRFDLEIRHLSFTYPNSDAPALQDIHLELPQGKRIAVVGPSGSGKTTLGNLLLRFWEYRQGEILLGGQPLHAFSQDDIRRSMGVVAQKTYLFTATVRDNLLLARPKATMDEIVQAAEIAQLHSFIEMLPQGYDTWIGEQGLKFSEGERQRLAIARALLKDAPFLLLDEPTANLDAITEWDVLQSLRRLMEGRTTMMITHRLIGLEELDEILVMNAGRIVERGRHEDLLELDGLYRKMWDLQNQAIGSQAVKNPLR